MLPRHCAGLANRGNKALWGASARRSLLRGAPVGELLNEVYQLNLKHQVRVRANCTRLTITVANAGRNE